MEIIHLSVVPSFQKPTKSGGKYNRIDIEKFETLLKLNPKS